MNVLASPITRIILRYLSGALVAWGLVTAETGAAIMADPDVQAVVLGIVGAALGLVSEVAYGRARSTGGPL